MANAINETPEYQAGFLAYKRGIPYNAQPFGLDDLKNKAWHIGWHEAADSVQTKPVGSMLLAKSVDTQPTVTAIPADVKLPETSNAALPEEQMSLKLSNTVEENDLIPKQTITKVLSIYIPTAQLDDVVNEIMFKLRSSGHKIVHT